MTTDCFVIHSLFMSLYSPLFSPLLSSCWIPFSSLFVCVREPSSVSFYSFGPQQVWGRTVTALVSGAEPESTNYSCQATVYLAKISLWHLIAFNLASRPDTVVFMVFKMLRFFVTTEQSIGVLRPMKSCRKSLFVAEPHLLGSGSIN